MADSGAGGTRGRQRAAVLAMVVLLAASAATAGVGTVAAGATAETTNESNPIKFVYVDSGTDNVTFVRSDGTRVGTNVSADIVGPMADLDDDGLLEAPYVTGSNAIYAVDENNETQFIADSTFSTSTKLGVNDWTDDGTPEVLYANKSDNKHIYYANVSGTPTEILGQQAGAVLGAVDFDGSGMNDIVYVDTSQQVYYYDMAADTDRSVEGVGQTGGGLGVGSPSGFYQDDTYWVPTVGGSQNLHLVNHTGKVNKSGVGGADKSPVAGVDWVGGNGELEFIYLDSSELHYATLNGTSEPLRDAGGDKINALDDAGVAGVTSYPGPLSVSDFEANATGDQNVTVNVTANQTLSELNVSLSGPENTTLLLDEDDFEQTRTNPYSYTATYDGSTDGVYEATVEHAASAGDSVSSADTDTAIVDAVAPVLSSVSLTDAANGDGSVGAGDTIEVTANATRDVGSVTANLSAFDAGSNVSLSHENDDTYNWTGEVGPNPNGGDQTADVTISDGQGNTDSTETGNLTVDTGELTVELADNRTVAAGEPVEFSSESVENASGTVDYEWEFDNGASATGETVNNTYNATGEYVMNLTVSDDTGETANASMNVTVQEPPAVESVNLTDVTDENGIVAPDDTVEVAATVSGDATAVTANLSAFGANSSVELTNESGDTYNRTFAVDSNATDGEQSVTVTVSGSDYTDSSETGALTVDTDELDVSLNDSRTVDAGEEVQYLPATVNDAVGDVDYEWEVGSSTVESGKTVTHAFDSAATYEVVLTASDGSNDTATASMKVEVVSSETVAGTTQSTDDSTTDSSTGGGSGGSLDSGGGTDPATETAESTSTEGTETSTATPTSTQTATGTETTTEDPQTVTEEAAATSGTSDQTPTTGTDDGTSAGNPGANQTPGEAPGFGPVAALLALLAAAALALRE